MTIVSPSAFAAASGSAEYKAPLKQTTSSQSFAGLLDDPAAILQAHRLFAFNELGMFGRSPTLQSGKGTAPEKATTHAGESPMAHNAGHRHTAITSPQTNAAPSVPRTAMELAFAPSANAAPDETQQIGSLSGPQEINEVVDNSDEASLFVTQNENPSLNANLSSAVAEGDGASADVSATQSTPESNRTDPSASPALANGEMNPVSLLVSGSADALVIAVRSPAETALNFVKLRQLIEDTAADFGMDIAEFRLNGGAELSFKSIAGGQHGSRAR